MTTSTDLVAALELSVPTGLLIGGKWKDATDGRTLDVYNPATGDVLAAIADGGPADADAALAAAVDAQGSWARFSPERAVKFSAARSAL